MSTENLSGFYEITRQDEIAIIRINKNVFEFITDINLTNELLNFIDNIHLNSDIKALLYYNDPDTFTDEVYDKFINRILGDYKSREECEPPYFTKKIARAREINIMNKIIKHLTDLHIIVVAGIQGTVVTPFIGTALAADFRYACEGAKLSMAHIKYGLHPSGGVPFFLSRFLHHSKALEIQFQDYIIASQALELGLINKIFKKDDFENQIISEIKEMTRLDYCTIQRTKRLTNFTRKSISDYFKYEIDMLNI